jgi:cell wall-associated NlpC family hydrolase
VIGTGTGFARWAAGCGLVLVFAGFGALVLIVCCAGYATGLLTGCAEPSSGSYSPVTLSELEPVADYGPQETFTASPTQTANAETIVETASERGMPPYAAVVAVATAIQESGLINLTKATNFDSLGLFQQRPSQGWGTPAELTDPAYASNAFLAALQKDVPDYQSVELWQAAQDVQRSGFPTAYAKWQSQATSMVYAIINGQSGGGCVNPAGVTNGPVALPVTGFENLPSGFTIPAGTPEAVLVAVEFADEQLGKPYVVGGNGPDAFDCSGLMQQAYLAAGIHIDRTTYQQVNDGTAVASTADLKPGDLVLIPGSDPEGDLPGHVGMYVGQFGGQGWIIQAPHTGTVVQATPLAGFTPVWSMRRIVAWPTTS